MTLIKPTTREAICQMAASSDGANNRWILERINVPRTAIPQHTRALVDQGRIHQSRRDGCKLRWFDTAERAAEWAAMAPMIPSEWVESYPVRQPRDVLTKKPGPPALIRYRAGEAAGVTIGKTEWKSCTADISKVVITTCTPSLASRWDAITLDPDPKYPPFASVRYGAQA